MASTIKRTSPDAAMSLLYKTAIDMVAALHNAKALSSRVVDQFEQFTTRTIGRYANDAAAATNHEDVPEDAIFTYQLNNG